MVQMEERNKDIMTKKKKSASKNPFLREQKQIFKYLSSEFPSQMKNIMVYPAYLHTAPNCSKTDVRLERTAPILCLIRQEHFFQESMVPTIIFL